MMIVPLEKDTKSAATQTTEAPTAQLNRTVSQRTQPPTYEAAVLSPTSAHVLPTIVDLPEAPVPAQGDEKRELGKTVLAADEKAAVRDLAQENTPLLPNSTSHAVVPAQVPNVGILTAFFERLRLHHAEHHARHAAFHAARRAHWEQKKAGREAWKAEWRVWRERKDRAWRAGGAEWEAFKKEAREEWEARKVAWRAEREERRSGHGCGGGRRHGHGCGRERKMEEGGCGRQRHGCGRGRHGVEAAMREVKA